MNQIKKFILIIGLMIIFPTMLHYAVSTFYPEPKVEQFIQALPPADRQLTAGERLERQTEQRRLNNERKAAEAAFAVRLFWVVVPCGLIAIIVGTLLKAQALGSGLMAGGIISIAEGYIRYWPQLPDYLHFISLFLAFILLIYIGYKKLDKPDNHSSTIQPPIL
jgi:hypothetical protein